MFEPLHGVYWITELLNISLTFDTHCIFFYQICLSCAHARNGTDGGYCFYSKNVSVWTIYKHAFLCMAATVWSVFLCVWSVNIKFCNAVLSYSARVCVVFSLFTLQQHVSVSSRCLQTSRSSCTPADPRAYRRASWSPTATSSLASLAWPSGYPTCGRQRKLLSKNQMLHPWKCDICMRDSTFFYLYSKTVYM